MLRTPLLKDRGHAADAVRWSNIENCSKYNTAIGIGLDRQTCESLLIARCIDDPEWLLRSADRFGGWHFNYPVRRMIFQIVRRMILQTGSVNLRRLGQEMWARENLGRVDILSELDEVLAFLSGYSTTSSDRAFRLLWDAGTDALLRHDLRRAAILPSVDEMLAAVEVIRTDYSKGVAA